MNFKLILFLSLLAVSFCVTGCTKKDKLTNNTMILSIEPGGDLTMSVGSSQALSAVIRNSKLEEIDEPVSWSVTNGIGTFTSQNKSTEFIAVSTTTAGENNKITLTCQGMSASVNVTVN